MRHTQSRLAVASATSRRVFDRLKVKLLVDAKIRHQAGDVVNVTPAEGAFLLSVGSAVKVEASQKVETASIKVEEVAEKAVKAPKAMPKTTTRKTTKK